MFFKVKAFFIFYTFTVFIFSKDSIFVEIDFFSFFKSQRLASSLEIIDSKSEICDFKSEIFSSHKEISPDKIDSLF
ncbi:MAG: hypothetical protein P1U46_04445 [Patescibacteria group bacterium]|nr:hypothetical protein [Patescibacteria group bacterium]